MKNFKIVPRFNIFILLKLLMKENGWIHKELPQLRRLCFTEKVVVVQSLTKLHTTVKTTLLLHKNVSDLLLRYPHS